MTNAAWITITVNGTVWPITNNVHIFQGSRQIVYYVAGRKKHFFYFKFNEKHIVCYGKIQKTRLLPELRAAIIERPDFLITDIQKVAMWKNGLIDMSSTTSDHRVVMGLPEQSIEITVITEEQTTSPMSICILL